MIFVYFKEPEIGDGMDINSDREDSDGHESSEFTDQLSEQQGNFHLNAWQ